MSLAPASTERRISATRSVKGDSPAGKPVDTAATPMPLLSSARTAVFKGVIDADRRHFDVQFFDAPPLDQIFLDGVSRLGGQPANTLFRVIA